MNAQRFISILLLSSTFIFHAADKDERFDRMIMAAAPPEVQWLPRVLNDPNERDDYGYSCASLVGKPGVGKTAMAFAVARKAGWEPLYIHQGHLSDKYRNASSKKLQDMLGDALRAPKTLIIFDEFNCLLENYDSSNHDTDILSRTAWCFLDEQHKNKNYDIFSIATMNRINKIPEEMKTRLHCSVEQIDNFKDPEQIKECFLLNLESKNITFTDESKQYLNKCFDELKITDLRMISSCASIVKMYTLARTQERPVSIMKEHIDGAIAKHKFNSGLMEFGKNNVSDEERRFQASQELQKEQMRISQEQFASSQALHQRQFNMNFGMSVLTFAAQTGFAAWHAYSNADQFAQTAKWHAAGMLANGAQLANSKYQFNTTMEFNREQFEASQENARVAHGIQVEGLNHQQQQAQVQQNMHQETMSQQQQQAQAQKDMHKETMDHQQGQVKVQAEQFDKSHKLQKRGVSIAHNSYLQSRDY